MAQDGRFFTAKFLDSEIELNCTLASVAAVSAVDDGERDENGRVQYALVQEAIIADRRALRMKLISRDRMIDHDEFTLEEANRFLGIEAARCRKLAARDRLVRYRGFTLEEAGRFLGIGEGRAPKHPGRTARLWCVIAGSRANATEAVVCDVIR